MKNNLMMLLAIVGVLFVWGSISYLVGFWLFPAVFETLLAFQTPYPVETPLFLKIVASALIFLQFVRDAFI
jgi:hypothetical protein